MIEKAPEFKTSEQNIKNMVRLQANGTLRPIQDEYLYWDKVKYKASDLEPTELWNAVKMQRYIKGNKVYFTDCEFSYVITDYIQKSIHQFDLNIGGLLGSNIEIAETDKTKYMISSIMEEAISSSQMEGANTTRKKAKEMIQRELKPKTKSEQMIMNNYLTMQYIVKHKSEPLTVESLLYIHRLMTADTLDKKEDEGLFRSGNDIYVVDQSKDEIVHEPPAADRLPILIGELCSFFNSNGPNFIHPIIKGIIIHFMIGWIHPFTDGNGRTARALFYWYLLQNGYWLTEYLSISKIIKDTKVQYEKAYLYTEIDDNDLTYFITYNLKTMERAYSALKEYIGRKQREVVQAAKFLRIPGVNERMAQIMKVLYDDPDRAFTIKEIENRFGVSNFTARADLKQLVEIGLMDVVNVNKIKQNYVRATNFSSVLKKYIS